MSGTKREVDFSGFSEDHTFESEFSEEGFTFTNEGDGSGGFRIHDVGGTRALGLPEGGALVALPEPVHVFGFTLGTFAGGVRLLFLDKGQRLLGEKQLFFPRRFENLGASMVKKPAYIRFIDGGNEAYLARLYVTTYESPSEPKVEFNEWRKES